MEKFRNNFLAKIRFSFSPFLSCKTTKPNILYNTNSDKIKISLVAQIGQKHFQNCFKFDIR